MCSLNSTRKNYASGYKSFADIIQQFREIGELPIQASFSSLDEGNGIEETLKRHEAKWHKSCFNKCSTLKLQRAHKGQPQNRELHALLFSNSVWAVFKGLFNNYNQLKITEPITSTLPFSANHKPIIEFMESFTHFQKQINEEQK